MEILLRLSKRLCEVILVFKVIWFLKSEASKLGYLLKTKCREPAEFKIQNWKSHGTVLKLENHTRKSKLENSNLFRIKVTSKT